MSSSSLPFTKMHGTGNDFVVLEEDAANPRDWAALAVKMCDRHFGIGSDGILVVQEPQQGRYFMRMFNPDGSEAEMCGNGIRCFARYLRDHGMVTDDRLEIDTLAGVKTVEFKFAGGKLEGVRIGMGAPNLAPAEIPVNAGGGMVLGYPLDVAGRVIHVTCVSMGNPHAVTFVDDVDTFPLHELGPIVEHHWLFPRRTNFEICTVLSRGVIKMRVWERGAGETLACGTGACATMVAAHLHGLVDDAVEMQVRGGTLRVEWAGEGDVMMTGSAEYVFTGDWPL